MKTIRIANAQAFWGDDPDATKQLLECSFPLDYITLDYLAEVSMSIMALQKSNGQGQGFAEDFIEVIRSCVPYWNQGKQFKIVTNAGGLDPEACLESCCKTLEKQVSRPIKITAILGDNIYDIVQMSATNHFTNLDTGERIDKIQNKLITANAYLGAQEIKKALDEGADIVIGGRIADPSLTVGPCLHHFKWKQTDWDKVAQATVAGHLIECGTQVTGGISTNWLNLSNQDNIGFPIVEITEDGRLAITKAEETGGCVSIETVKEQLLYEIGDPARYMSPDAIVSFQGIQVHEIAKNKIGITGSKGFPPTKSYKVSCSFLDGYRTECTLVVFGHEAIKKAQKAGEMLLKKIQNKGFTFEDTLIECLGSGAVAPGIDIKGQFPEIVLRVAVKGQQIEALECFSKTVASLVTSGPQGTTGYLSGRPKIRPVHAFWPAIVNRNQVTTSLLTKTII
jgi:hypothetical protein